MKKYCVIIFLMLVTLGLPGRVLAFTPADLTIIEIKPTGSESIVLENTASATINLDNYILQYFNNKSPSNLNVPTDSQALPDFSLSAGQSFLLSGDNAATCGASGEANLGMSLSDTSGYVQIVKAASSGGSTTLTTQDHVSWASSTTGADIVSVPSSSSDAQAVWYRKLSDGSWSKYEIDTTPCNLLVTITSSSGTGYVQWAAGRGAPSVILAGASGSGIPATDKGLAAVQITELLPNPAGTGTDDTDEFVELYNPNAVAFDLSGFTIETGLTTKHDYTFAAGTSLPAKTFGAFYSADTNLTLSNSGSQAWLLDPLGNIVSKSDAYQTAKDGLGWALANGSWYWTTKLTPNAANIILAAAGSSGSVTQTTPSGSNSASDSSGGSGSTSNSTNTAGTTTQPEPLHPQVLAGVGSAALLYAGYEYRHDLANGIYRLRRYREARAAAGPGAVSASLAGIVGRFGRGQNYVRAWLGRWFKK